MTASKVGLDLSLPVIGRQDASFDCLPQARSMVDEAIEMDEWSSCDIEDGGVANRARLMWGSINKNSGCTHVREKRCKCEAIGAFEWWH
jgi:hypothetical protein